ncbi:MAG: putative rane protein [Pseudothermotoga sp.]|nr:putative rane protein [Pseudothermotoga sp.]
MINIFRGFLIGLANLVPGVSGATMAVIVGVYERLIDAVANFVKFRFKREQISFIVALGIGILAAIFAGSVSMKHLLERSPAMAYAIFFGLVLGSIPRLRREISDLKLRHFALGVSLMLIFELLVRTVQLSGTYVLLTGIIAACAMILPGLSGSLVLLILGVYDDILDALVNLKLAIVVPFGIGVILGIALMALLMNWLVGKFPNQTRSFTFGLVVASIIRLEPFTKQSMNLVRFAFVFLIASVAAYLSFRLSYRSSARR